MKIEFVKLFIISRQLQFNCMFLKMLLLNILIILICLKCYVISEWVEIQQNTPKSVYKIQTALTSFSDSPSLFLSNSNMNKVYSYQTPLEVKPVQTTTTEMTKIMYNNQQHENLIKLHYPERFTSTTTTVPSIIVEIHDKIDEFPSTDGFTERVDLKPPETIQLKKKNSTVLNQKIPVRVASPPILVSVGKKLKSSEEDAEEDEEGVTIVEYDEEEYEDDPEEEEVEEYEEKVVEKVKPVPKRPKPTPKLQNNQRRILKPKVNVKPKLDNSLNFTGFVKFLKSIQENFATKTARNINDKVRILRRFRDNLLLSIEERIRNLWKTKPKRKRTKRTLGGNGGSSDSNSMEFPSAEGALLSISFLTFSVFLIKLVLVRLK